MPNETDSGIFFKEHKNFSGIKNVYKDRNMERIGIYPRVKLIWWKKHIRRK